MIIIKQNNSKSNMEIPSITDKKNTFQFPYLDSEVTVSGSFDSGNLNNAFLDNEKNVTISYIQEIVLTFGKDK